MRVRNWNRIQKANFWVYFIDVKNKHECYMNFENVRISLTRVRYWYEIRDIFTNSSHGEELVPNIHGVIFTKCEIYGSTMLSLKVVAC